MSVQETVVCHPVWNPQRLLDQSYFLPMWNWIHPFEHRFTFHLCVAGLSAVGGWIRLGSQNMWSREHQVSDTSLYQGSLQHNTHRVPSKYGNDNLTESQMKVLDRNLGESKALKVWAQFSFGANFWVPTSKNLCFSCRVSVAWMLVSQITASPMEFVLSDHLGSLCAEIWWQNSVGIPCACSTPNILQSKRTRDRELLRISTQKMFVVLL